MSNTITLKKSGVSGNAPASGDLSLGEIALNYADGHLYYKSGVSATPAKINAGDADNADTVDGFHLNQNVLTTSTPTFDKLRLTNGSDASLTSTLHAFQIGASSGQNLIIDNNEIVSRSNGGASVLYLQNDGGDVMLGTNGGTSRLFVQDGTATHPAIAFNDDTNTGIYRSGADVLKIVTGGTEALAIDSSQNATFVGSVTAYSFIKDGGANSEFLKADGGVDSNTYLTTSSASSTYLPLAGGTMTGHILLNNGIELRSKDTSSNIKTIARVNSSNQLEYGWSGGGPVKFMGGGSYTERMRIHTNGNVGIGTTSPAKTLDVSASGSNQGIYLNISDVGRLHMYADGSRNYFAGVSGNGHRFTTTGGANVEILNNGNVGIGDTTPSYKLDVNGTLRATSAAYFNNDVVVTNNLTLTLV
jgi:hypothetical protein